MVSYNDNVEIFDDDGFVDDEFQSSPEDNQSSASSNSKNYNGNGNKNNNKNFGVKVDFYYNPSQGQIQFLLLQSIKNDFDKSYVLQIQAAKVEANNTVQYKGRTLNKCDWKNKIIMNLSSVDISNILYEYQKQRKGTEIKIEIKHPSESVSKFFSIISGKEGTLGLRIAKYTKSNYDNKNQPSPNVDLTIFIKEAQIYRFFEMLKSVLQTQLSPMGLFK